MDIAIVAGGMPDVRMHHEMHAGADLVEAGFRDEDPPEVDGQAIAIAAMEVAAVTALELARETNVCRQGSRVVRGGVAGAIGRALADAAAPARPQAWWYRNQAPRSYRKG